MNLYQQASGSYDIVGISLSDADASRQYAADHDLPFRVFLPQDPQAFTTANRIRGVPTTLRIGSDGTVRQVWLGALGSDVVAELTGKVFG